MGDEPHAEAAPANLHDYELFLQHTYQRRSEMAIRFNPIDCLWYAGWWPFNQDGWQSLKMNAMLREIQPHLFFNGRKR